MNPVLELPRQEVKPVLTEAMATRQAQEVQVAMLAAKKFPRDQNESLDRILKACERKTLAQKALYSYPRGDTTVTGPSIRLAETIKQNWGNMEAGVIELEQKLGESVCMSYAWDYESNNREVRTFTIKHERKAKNGTQKLTDDRDIYEKVANNGARRERACILAIVPGDVVEAAVEKCKSVLKTELQKDNRSFTEKIKDLFDNFKEFNVTKEMIQKFIGSSSIKEEDYIKLLGAYNSLKDGVAKPDAFFEFGKENLKDPLVNDFLNDLNKGGALNGNQSS